MSEEEGEKIFLRFDEFLVLEQEVEIVDFFNAPPGKHYIDDVIEFYAALLVESEFPLKICNVD